MVVCGPQSRYPINLCARVGYPASLFRSLGLAARSIDLAFQYLWLPVLVAHRYRCEPYNGEIVGYPHVERRSAAMLFLRIAA